MEKCQFDQNLTKFATCSTDRTIRFWHHIDTGLSGGKTSEITKCLARNAYCKDMSKIIFINSGDKQSFDHFKARPLDRNIDGALAATSDQQDSIFNEMIDSLRCFRISPDGTHLASGDQLGVIRIHDLESGDIEEIKQISAHDNEVICLAYSPAIQPTTTKSLGSSLPLTKERFWLASGSRDKLIHVFDSESNYEYVSMLEHHSSTITSVKFNQMHKIVRNQLQ